MKQTFNSRVALINYVKSKFRETNSKVMFECYDYDIFLLRKQPVNGWSGYHVKVYEGLQQSQDLDVTTTCAVIDIDSVVFDELQHRMPFEEFNRSLSYDVNEFLNKAMDREEQIDNLFNQWSVNIT